jgi:FtsP/CotA-like multicopper oxidase with cupredoxin domain
MVLKADQYGTYLEPMEIDSLEIGLGQRYSVLIETKAEPEKEK